MHYSVDVKNEYQVVKSKLFRISLLFSLILTAIIVADILLVTLSKDNYIPCLIVSIVITISFAWFMIFFFTNIFSETNNKYRYFKGYELGLHPTEEVEFLRQSDELCYINGLYVYPVYVRYMSNLSAQDKVIFSLKNDLPYEMGDKLTLVTYQRVIISAEKHKWWMT